MTSRTFPSLPQAAFRMRRDGTLLEVLGDPLDFGGEGSPFRRGGLTEAPRPVGQLFGAEAGRRIQQLVDECLTSNTVTFRNAELVIAGVRRAYEVWMVPMAGEEVACIVTNVAARARLDGVVLAAEAREQRRIAKAVHDGLAQLLTGLALLANSLARRGPGQATVDELLEVEAVTREAIARTRALAQSLAPAGMESSELATSLEQLAAETSRTQQVECSQACDDPGVLDSVAANQLYRIAQEAVANAARHARARHIHVALERRARDILLTVSDDGIGIDPEQVAGGSGLELMRVRSRVIGGALTVEPRDGGGTVVRCVLRDAISTP